MKIENCNWLKEIYKNLNFEKLPHGIIINGPNGIGKKILAKEIASNLLINKISKILDSDLIKSNTHPDLFVLNKDKIILKHVTYRKTLNKDKWDEELGERNLNEFLAVTPSIALNKVALIFNAQTMNLESQNAILKSLEEPAPNTYIIFTTNRSKSLLKTIYSRCQIINIPNLNESLINNWLNMNGITDLNSSYFPSFFSPLNILRDIQDDKHNNFKDFLLIISDYIENKIDINSAIKNMSSLDIELTTKTNFLIEFLKILLKSRILSEDLSGFYKKFNSSKFSNLKISNLINDLNELRFKYFKVPQINETHVLNYFLCQLKSSIKI